MKFLRLCCLLFLCLAIFSARPTTAQSEATSCPLTWQMAPTPNVGSDSNALSAVAAVSINDVWAAGYYRANNGDHSLMLRWNGTAWSNITVPDVGWIKDIVVIAPNDIWASGTSPLHWNGTEWQVINSPTGIDKFSALSSESIWAVGGDEDVLHWDGAEWAIVPFPDITLPNPTLSDIHAVSENDVWVVGYFTPGSVGVYSIVKHWNGSEWKSVPDDYAGYVFLRAIDGSADGTLWVAGSASWRASVEKWDGTAWRYITIPHVYGDSSGNDNFFGIDVRTVDDVWAVGSAQGFYPSWQPENPLIQHWDGAVWSIERVPFSVTDSEQLESVSTISSTEVWAVGGKQVGGVYQTLALYGTLPCNTSMPIPAPPKLVTPPRKAKFTALPIELRWERSAGATFYHVRLTDIQAPHIIFTQSVKRPRKVVKRIPSLNRRFVWGVSACNDYGCSIMKERLFYFFPSSQ